MRRTLIQLDEATYRRVRERAFREERSMSSVIREIVRAALDDDRPAPRASRLGEFASVGAGRSKPPRGRPVSEDHDAALAAAFSA